jgi:hypothetical protein
MLFANHALLSLRGKEREKYKNNKLLPASGEEFVVFIST